jgi:tRNA G37 N-methylase TrmD
MFSRVYSCFLVMIIGEAFIRAKQSLICLNNPENTCVCGHYEPLNKRWVMGIFREMYGDYILRLDVFIVVT